MSIERLAVNSLFSLKALLKAMLNIVPVRPAYHRRVAGVLAKGLVERGVPESSPKVSSGALAPEPLGALLLKASSGGASLKFSLKALLSRHRLLR